MLKFVVPALALLMLAVLSACGEAGGERPQPTPTEQATAADTQTATPTQPPGGAGGGDEGTVVPILTPFPSPEPVPADWATYTDPCGHFSFSYPQSWFLQASTADCSQVSVIVSTFELGSVGPRFPEGSVKVDIGAVSTTIVNACVPEGAAPAFLSGVPGGQIVLTYDLQKSDGVTRAHDVAAALGGICFTIGANFGQDSPINESTFLQIVDSFKVAK
jgi:hypothetical protein